MSLKYLVKFVLKSNISVIMAMMKPLKGLFRAGYIYTGLTSGVYDVLTVGPATVEELSERLGIVTNHEGFEAWLRLGLSLKELEKESDRYRIKGYLSKQLTKETNAAWCAFFLSRVEVFYEYIKNTPRWLKANERPVLDEAYGELFALSSHTVAPMLEAVVDQVIPRQGPCHLLEIGCGTGKYVRQACDLNGQLSAVGLELQAIVAEMAQRNMDVWRLGDRVSIVKADVLDYCADSEFNLITFYNLIYYFPLEDRANLLNHLNGLLKPGGRLISATLCQGSDPSTQAMDLWSTMTKGCGPLPQPGQFVESHEAAGFKMIEIKQLIPNFWLFIAEKPRSNSSRKE